ncbi:hypothetical protein HU200_046389 [Digitaria exilis]|uniref:Uncharacterized protein n=1 Tax=Digitaria exilis TaxID=1010633 RepID=A0A835ECK3_9POAL|nr:hypothetical protein HU200_046389 [Digitaria exilis]
MALVLSMRLSMLRRGARVVAGNPSSYHRIATVSRQEAELVGPARPTPRETKRPSDIDDQEGLRFQVPVVLFYRRRVAGGNGDDPVRLIRRALGEALVPYHRLAGRLREVEGRKLVVDCSGEGVLFVEADADVRLAELEAAGLRPPFPCMDQLLCEDFDVQGSGGGGSPFTSSPGVLNTQQPVAAHPGTYTRDLITSRNDCHAPCCMSFHGYIDASGEHACR